MRVVNHIFSNSNAFPRQSYFVASNGNDSNNGTSPATPWQTLTKVNATTFVAGDHIFFRRGDTFYGSLTINQSGTITKPIVFSAYGVGANPIITGFSSTTNWTDKGSNIWETTNAISTLSSCNMVTVNGVNTGVGRYPKESDPNGGYYTYQSSTATSITSTSLTGTPDWTGATVVMKTNTYTLKRALVTSQSTSTINFATISPVPEAGFGFFFINDIRCCTSQNDWYYDVTSKKLSVYSTAQPTNFNISTVDYLFTVNSNYIKIDSLSFTGANICGVYSWSNYTNLSITNCTFSFIGFSAIYLNVDNVLVKNCSISNCNSNAISVIYSSNPSIRNNIVEDISLLPSMRYSRPDPLSLAAAAIELSNSTGCTVEYNSVTNVGYSGIGASNALIKNNYIDNFCTIFDDGGGIYGCYNATITGNIVLNGIGNNDGIQGTRFPAAGIYLDQGSYDVEISYNTVANCYKYGYFIASLGNVNSHHNLSYNNSEIQFRSVYWGFPATSPSTTDQINNNILVSRVRNTDSYDSYQICLGFYYVNQAGNSNDNPGVILASTSLDNNYYARPIADTKTIFLNVNTWADCWRTLEEWQTLSGKDQNSHKSSQAIANVNDFQFEYNETNTTKNITLSYDMLDITGIIYTAGVVTLQPYTSLLLIKKV